MSVTIFKRDGEKYKNLPWCVRWDDFSSGSKRRKEKGFVSKKAAEQFRRDRIDPLGKGEVLLSPEDEAAVKLCRQSGLDLLEVVRVGLERLRALPDVEREVPTVFWAFESFLEDCERRNLRDKTLKSYASLCRPFVRSRRDKLVSVLDAVDLREYICGRYEDEVSRATARRTLLRFLNWCADRPREWLPVIDGRDVTWDKSIETARRPVVFSVDEARDFIFAVDDRIKAAVALGLFAGVRPEELRRMRWSWTDERGDWFGVDFARRKVELAGEWTKIRRARTLHDLPDNLWVWLERFGPGAAGANGANDYSPVLVPVDERMWYRLMREARVAAGIKKCGADMMRHSFGSYHRHRGLDLTVDILGHTGDLGVFNRHYNNNSIGPEDAERFFGIRP